MRKLLIALCLLIPYVVVAQVASQKTIFSKKTTWTHFEDKHPLSLISNKGQFEMGTAQKTALGLSQKEQLVLSKQTTDNLGYTHHRFQQHYQGIPIEGAEYIVHENKGYRQKANGKLLKNVDINTIPSISEVEALLQALDHIGALQYAWESETMEELKRLKTNDPNATYCPMGKLTIVADNEIPNANSPYRLAYKFDILATLPLQHWHIFVDAHTGNIITKQNRICGVNALGSGLSNYVDTVDITCDYQTDFRLRETNRVGENATATQGTDIIVKKFTGYTIDSLGTIHFLSEDYTSTTGNWLGDSTKAAVDVKWGIEQVVDYLWDVHSREGLDGQGEKIVSLVEVLLTSLGVGFTTNGNALLMDGIAFFGTGDTILTSPTSLDIVAHELAHGLTQHTANLTLEGESGALNEAFSDIFAIIIEHYAHPNGGNWLIADEATPDNLGIRNIENPNLAMNPSTYQGIYWQTNCTAGLGGSCSNHNNSTVFSHAFYLMVEGGTVIQELTQETIDITGIGMEAAREIAYRSLTTYLTSHADFADARNSFIESAIDLYGADSDTVLQVVNALCAVGLGSCTFEGKSITVLSPNGGEVWVAGATIPITWASIDTTGTMDSVKIEYTINGVTWQIISPATLNDHTYNWTVPDVASPLVKIRISEIGDFTVSDTSDDYFRLESCSPTAWFVASDSLLCTGSEVTFYNHTILPPYAGQTYIYEWSINGSLVATDSNLVHTFSTSGSYELTLAVSSSGNCLNEYSQTVAVQASPSAAFTYSANGLEVAFSAHFQDGNSYAWSVDSVVVGSGAAFTHVFGDDGGYEVCLSVGGDCGSTVFCETVDVFGADGCQDWEHYLNRIQIKTIIEEGNFLWVGTAFGGIIKFNKNSGDTTVYDAYNSGLPSNWINTIAIDGNGDKWIGTYDSGLVHFDGINWTVYNTVNSALPHNRINSIAIDSNGDKWIGTYNGGMVHFNGANWIIYNTANSNIPSNRVNCIIISANDNKYVGTNNGGADFDDTNWIIYNTTNTALLSNNINDIVIDNIGHVWFGTSNGLAQFDGFNWTIYNTTNSNLPNNLVWKITVDAANNKCIGTSGGGAYFDGTNWAIYYTTNSGLPSNIIYEIIIDDIGKKWIGTAEGFVSFNGISWQTYNLSNSGLPNFNIRAIAIDNNNHKWIGTDKGLVYYDGINWIVYNTSNSSLPNDLVMGLTVDDNNNIWIGTNNGLAYFDGISWLVYNQANTGYPMLVIRSILLEDNGDKWIGTGNGLLKFNGFTWTQYTSSNSGLLSNVVYSIVLDNNGDKWIGTGTTPNGGLIHFDGINWTSYTTANSGLPRNWVYSIAIDENGDKWVGTSGSGLAHFDDTNWTVYNSSNSILPNNYITAIVIDSNNGKWIGTKPILGQTEGVCSIQNGNWLLYDIENSELPCSDIFGIALDNTENKWIFGFKGIGVLATTNVEFDFSELSGCTSEAFSFTNTSQGSTSQEWQINGTTISTNTDLTHTFTAPGTYQVTLITNGDCEDRHTETVTIHPHASSLQLGIATTTCTNSLLLDAEADYAAYLWSTGDTTQSIIVTQSGTYTVDVTDHCGNTASDSKTVTLVDDCVYPGDLNADGIANYRDLLHLGLGYGGQGSVRNEATLAWIGQSSPNWQLLVNDTDYKHIDSNGDGCIDMQDIEAIGFNYNKTHHDTLFNPNITATPTVLSLSNISYEPDPDNPGLYLLSIDLTLENNNNLMVTAYGVAFVIDYSSIFNLLAEDFTLDFTGSWLGTQGEDMTTFVKHFPDQHRIEVAITRIDHQNISGTGAIGHLNSRIAVQNLPTQDELTLSLIESPEAVLNNGTYLSVGNPAATLVIAPPTPVQASAFLQGPFQAASGLMSTTLNSNNLLPTEQPFNRLPWNYEGTECVGDTADIPTNVVDWVLVELRSIADTTIVEQKAAFLLNDGSIVDIDGVTNGVNFYKVSASDHYYIVLRHRNHLAVMSAMCVDITSGMPFDFRMPSNVLGSEQVVDLGNGQFGLRAGDIYSNGIVTVNDVSHYNYEASGLNQYLDTDLNMDNIVSVADFNLYLPNSSLIGVAPIRY